MISECVKRFWNQGIEPQLYLWRDSNQNEVNLLIEYGGNLQVVEMKSNATLNNSFFKGLKKFQEISGLPDDSFAVVYGGDVDYQTDKGKFISWRNW